MPQRFPKHFRLVPLTVFAILLIAFTACTEVAADPLGATPLTEATTPASAALQPKATAIATTAVPTTTPTPEPNDAPAVEGVTPGPGDTVEPAADTLPLLLTEAWSDVWLCADEDVAVEDLTVNTTLNCSVGVEVQGDTLVINASGIPNHDFESTLGCCAAEIDNRWVIPLDPQPDSDGELTMAPERGPVAFTVSGVAIYGPEEGPGGDAVALEHGLFEEDRQPIDLGVCGGHAGPGGQYHYHFDANCIHWHSDGDEEITDYEPSDLIANGEAELIGFAFDGYPIYGTYEQDVDGTIVEVTSSYRLIEGANGYGGIDDYEYVDGLGDLDTCNGHIGSTPQAPDGIYHYHSTLTNGNGDLGFPYFLLCYYGEIDDASIPVVNAGPLGGGRFPGGGPPPPRPR
ncbi:MAG: YHYH protein [Chloroflexi bacterium]|nr:YHYH protein [Chloroflexota bacterium]